MENKTYRQIVGEVISELTVTQRAGYNKMDLQKFIYETAAERYAEAYAEKAVLSDREQILNKQQTLIRDCFSRNGGQWAN